MRSDGLRFTPLLIATGLTLAAVLAANGEERLPRRGRSIQFSEPRSDVVSSNVNQLGTKQMTLKDLEQNLKKPFELFSPVDDPTAGFATPPVPRTLPSPAKSRRMKELLAKRNEWIFSAPEDYSSSGLTAEEMFNLPEFGPNGEEQKRKTPMEKYLARTDKSRAETQAVTTNHMADSESPNPHPTDEKQDGLKELSFGGQESPLSSGLSDMEKTAKRLSPANSAAFGTTAVGPATARSFFDIFGFGKTDSTEPTPEKSRAMERMQEFKQLLETRSLTPPNPGAGRYNPLAGAPGTAPSTVAPAGYDVFPSAGALGVPSPLLPGPNSLAPWSGLPTAATSLGLPSWQATLPAPQTPRMTLPPPTFNVPQRKF